MLLLALVALPALHSQAQVRIGVGINIGPSYGVYHAPPVCEWGFYPDYPFGCAPYGYYGPEWFADGVFIGAGPWYNFYYVRPAYYRPYYVRSVWYVNRFHDRDRFFRDERFDHDRGFRGHEFREHEFREHDFDRGRRFHEAREFHDRDFDRGERFREFHDRGRHEGWERGRGHGRGRD
ncbi:MAG TPA: hypothetical protein VFR84_07725 [Candidatus Angelobacter sp.]|nr:hypothetical protein [Candidatus Angelobacter sp.]